jgi:hypothetical protein
MYRYVGYGVLFPCTHNVQGSEQGNWHIHQLKLLSLLWAGKTSHFEIHDLNVVPHG